MTILCWLLIGLAHGSKNLWMERKSRVVLKQLRPGPRCSRFTDLFASKNHVALVARVHPEKDRRKPDISSKSSPLETYERISGRIISLSLSFPKDIVAMRGNCWTSSPRIKLKMIHFAI
ncbi:PREDICTED: uncharacterized protein LOC105461270 [Wasmannia auropunctata]|uniref:uncharacterized protein LOC105461270 n=1 Tax=Wasmannia auropunctata TaxID=64793 RepID=UPI0005EE23AC|nr:PREDICTED: uncharacterized protein LOC105461270 [Wasmannia auropunctata]